MKISERNCSERARQAYEAHQSVAGCKRATETRQCKDSEEPSTNAQNTKEDNGLHLVNTLEFNESIIGEHLTGAERTSHQTDGVVTLLLS